LSARNGRAPLCNLHDGAQGIDKLLATTAIDPPLTPQSEKNQALPDLQARWLTRRFLLSAPLAAALASLVFGERT
jgi:hypothetical protein